MMEYIVALVDDSVILQSELEHFTKIQQFENQLTGTTLSEEAILDNLIVRRIQLNHAQKRNIDITDAGFNQRIEQLAQENNLSVADYVAAQETFPGGIRGWRNFLYQNLVIEEFQRREIFNLINISEEDARNFLLTEAGQDLSNLVYQVGFIAIPRQAFAQQSDQFIQQQLDFMRQELESSQDFASPARELTQNMPLAEIRRLDLRRLNQLPSIFSNRIPLMRVGNTVAVERDNTFYLVKLLAVSSPNPIVRSEVQSRHILLQPSILRSPEQTLIEINALRQRIINGEPFDDMARVFSESAVSARDGGNLGWLPFDQLDPAYAEAARTLELGTVSQPVQTAFGYHLIEVQARTERDISEEVELNRIQQYIFQNKIADELPRFLAGLRQRAYVAILHLVPPQPLAHQ